MQKSSYLTTFACQLGRYKFARLSFRVASVRGIVQWKIGEILKDLTNVFGIAHDILIVGFNADERDHDKTLIT